MIEPYLLHEFEEDFYGQTLRLLVTGYIRPVRVVLGLLCSAIGLAATHL